jgi:hypothetical protein
MLEEVETGDVFRAAYLVSRGGRVVKACVQGLDHVVLTVKGEELDHEDLRYRTGAGMVEPLMLKENLNRVRDLVKKTLRTVEHPDRRFPHAAHPSR